MVWRVMNHEAKFQPKKQLKYNWNKLHSKECSWISVPAACWRRGRRNRSSGVQRRRAGGSGGTPPPPPRPDAQSQATRAVRL